MVETGNRGINCVLINFKVIVQYCKPVGKQIQEPE